MRLKLLRASARAAPVQPLENEQRLLSQRQVATVAQTSGPLLAWNAHVCRYRDAFASTALVFTRGATVAVYMFLFAKQQPTHAMFAPLSPIEEGVPCCIDTSEEERVRAPSEYFEWAFELDWCDYVTEQEVEFDEETIVAELLGLMLREGRAAVTHGELAPP